MKPPIAPFRNPRMLIIIILGVIMVAVLATVNYYRDSAQHPAYLLEQAGGDTLTVAVAYSPMSLYRLGDSLKGFNYEMMAEMSRMYHFPVKFIPVAGLEPALADLSRGRCDVLMADIPMFKSLKEKYRFTVPVYTDRQVLVTADSVYRSALSLGGKSVYVAAGSPAQSRLENLSREIGDTIHIVVKDVSPEHLVMLVARREIPCAVVNRGVALKLRSEYPDLRLSDNIAFTQLQSWILNRDSRALQDTLDVRIERFKATPEYAALLEEYTYDPFEEMPAESGTLMTDSIE